MPEAPGTTRVYDSLARVTLAKGVDTCFALLGDADMNWATRLADGGCRMIYVRHEHCAVAAAMAYARKTGGVGLATTTCGPGLTQIVTALPAAVRASLPVVVVAGEAPLGKAWYNQGIDQGPIITATGAAYHALHSVPRMPEQLRGAFAQARRERRPVVVGVPFDLQDQPWTGSDTLPAPSASLIAQVGPMPPHPDDIARAADRLASARRIVVMAGLGATHAAAEAQALADRLDALLATSLPARGLLAGHPFSIGIAGGFSSDIAPVVQSQGRIAAHSHIRADAALGLAALAAAVPPRPADWRSPTLAAAIATTPPDGTPRPTAGPASRRRGCTIRATWWPPSRQPCRPTGRW